MQIELLKKYVKQPICANQLQFSVSASNMIANGMEVNMVTEGSVDHDSSVLDYCRVNDITVQAWSPLRREGWKNTFIDNDECPELNTELKKLSDKYGVSKTTIATAWILRHPAKIQVITGTTNEDRLNQVIKACDIELTREDWYSLYLSAGHPLP